MVARNTASRSSRANGTITHLRPSGSHRAFVKRRRKVFKRKKVKVSRKLRKKVQKVINSNNPDGYYHEVSGSSVACIANGQQVFHPNQQLSEGQPGWHFTPTQVLDAASILWNGKTPLINKSTADPGNMSTETLQVLCKNSWYVCRMKNNSQHTLTVKPVVCRPKKVVTDNAVTSWTAELLNQATNPTGENPRANVITDLYQHPKFCSGMNRFWSFTTSKIVLEPGQEYTFTVQGPQDRMYKMASCYDANLYKNNQTYAANIFYLVNGDLQSDSALLPQRSANTGAGALLMENSHHYTLEMPEQTGWHEVGPLPNVVTNDLRRKAVVFHNFMTTGGTATQIDEDNPATIISPPL